MRLSIDVSPEQHQRLKAMAALSGQSLKEYVLSRVLPEVSADAADDALRQLEALLQPRIEAAENGVVVQKSVRQIYEDVLKDAR